MLLNKLLYPWIKNNNIPKIDIIDINLNSKLIKCGHLFFAINGHLDKGYKYINESINNGAIVIIIDTNNIIDHGRIINNKKPIIFFYKLNSFISEISGNFYNNPSEKINLIGITGTNGKTTVLYFSSQLINIIDKNKSAVISTIGNGIIPNLKLTNNTTDSPIYLQKILNKYYLNNIKTVFIEITSHSLSQHRVKNLKFKYVIYTNISHEHLDYHKNMFNYKMSKYSLFNKHKVDKSIINIDDEFGKEISNKINNNILVSLNKKIYIKSRSIFIKVNNIKFFKYNSILNILINNIKFNIKLNFIGIFNINNFLLSLILLIDMGYNINYLIKISSFIKLPPGRMEIIKYNNIDIMIDYAHTPVAMKKILNIVNKLYIGKIWCIFGCGGDRDIYKRSIMGKLSIKYSNNVILTTDNSRNENIYKIINDIMLSLKNKKKINIILDRKKAIEFSILNSNNNDIILILGKGHEKFQIIDNKIIKYSDKDTVISIIKKLNVKYNIKRNI